MIATLLLTSLAPAIVCGSLLAIARAWASDGATRRGWAVPLGLTLGFVVGLRLIDGAFTALPLEAGGWLMHVALAAGVVALLDGRGVLSARARLVAYGVVAALMVLLFVRPLVGGAWSGAQAFAWIAAFIAVVAVSIASAERLSRRGTGLEPSLVLLLVAVGLAQVLLFSGSARYAQYAGAVASALGPLVVLGAWRRDQQPLGRAAPLVATLLAGILVLGMAYVELPVLAFVALAVAPAAGLLPDVGRLAARPRWQRELARVLVIVLLVTAALVISLPKPGSWVSTY